MSGDAEILRRVPPQDFEAEQSTLGAILLEPAAIEIAAEIVEPKDFYSESHRSIFGAMLDLRRARISIDPVTLVSQLGSHAQEIGGPQYIAQLAAFVPSALNIADYARIVRDKSTLRSFITTSTQLASDAFDATDVDEFLAGADYDLAPVLSRSTAPPEPSKDAAIDQALWRIEHGSKDLVRTGIPAIDANFDGFSPGSLSILASRTSRGKTQLAVNFSINAARDGKGVAFFSLEMSLDEIWPRFLSCEADVNIFRARHLGFRDNERARVDAARASLKEMPLAVRYRPGLPPRDLRVECRRIIRDLAPLKLVIVDYLGLMRGDVRQRERWNEIREAVIALKDVAGELGVAMLVCSQLNREAVDDQRPTLRHLRDSGAAEEHSSNVLMLWQAPAKTSWTPGDDGAQEIEVLIEKQRNGPAPLRIPLLFNKRSGRFTDSAAAENRNAA